MRPALTVLLALCVCACTREPDCAELARHIAEVARRADAETTASTRSPTNELTPLFGAYGAEIGAICQRGGLSREARRCFLAAQRGSDLDRCGHRHVP